MGSSRGRLRKKKKITKREESILIYEVAFGAGRGITCASSLSHFNWLSSSFHSASPEVISESLLALVAEECLLLVEVGAKEMWRPSNHPSEASVSSIGDLNVGEKDDGRLGMGDCW